MLKKIVKTIDCVRMERHMTLKELSKKSGVSEKHISQINTGKTVPTLETLAKLATPLGLRIEVIISSKDTNSNICEEPDPKLAA